MRKLKDLINEINQGLFSKTLTAQILKSIQTVIRKEKDALSKDKFATRFVSRQVLEVITDPQQRPVFKNVKEVKNFIAFKSQEAYREYKEGSNTPLQRLVRQEPSIQQELKKKIVHNLKKKWPGDSAEDIFQDAFCVLWENIKSGKISDPAYNIHGFLVKTCRNIASNNYRERKETIMRVTDEQGDQINYFETIPGKISDVKRAEKAENLKNELIEAIKATGGRFSTKQKHVFELELSLLYNSESFVDLGKLNSEEKARIVGYGSARAYDTAKYNIFSALRNNPDLMNLYLAATRQ
jgi:DNA-directed RNA polymerase specialized sigma24 family protein